MYPTKYEANSLLGLIGKQWKYIQTTRPELYDLQKDPGEQTNMVDAEPQRARILQDRLAQILERGSHYLREGIAISASHRSPGTYCQGAETTLPD